MENNTVDGVKVLYNFPDIYPSIDSVLDWIRKYENDDIGYLSLYSDRSGKLYKDMREKESISFDSIQHLVNLLKTYVVRVTDFDKFNLDIEITDFKENMIVEIETIWDGELHYGTGDYYNWLKKNKIMRNNKDLKGLQKFLIENKILPDGSTLVFEYPKYE